MQRTSKRSIRFVTLALASVALTGPGSVSAQETLRTKANSAIASFQENIERFEFLTCEYDYTKAKTLTDVDAMNGKWMARQPGDTAFPNTARVSMIKDGKLVRYAIVADADSLKTQKEGHKSTKADPKNPGLAFGPAIAFTSSTQLFNGVDSLSFMPSDGVPGGMSNSVSFCGKGTLAWAEANHESGFLLNIICGGGERSLWRLASASRMPIEVRVSPHRGVECVWLTIQDPKGQKVGFALDPAKGHMARCVIWKDEKGSEYWRQEVTEIRECSNGRFFPVRVVSYMTQNRGFWLASEYKVTKLDVDNRPSRESLMLDLPAGTAVSDLDGEELGKVNPTIFLKQNERIHPDEIPKLRDLIARKQEQPLADTALHPPGTSWWKWALGGVGIVLVLAAAVWRVRSRRALGAAA